MEIVEPRLSDLESKEKEYSEGSLWDKIAKYSKAAGCSVVYAALLLFYAAHDEKIPRKTNMIIYGALGYFISPLDLIPDITPIVGYADDMAGLLLALGVVSMYITDDVKKTGSVTAVILHCLFYNSVCFFTHNPSFNLRCSIFCLTYINIIFYIAAILCLQSYEIFIK